MPATKTRPKRETRRRGDAETRRGKDKPSRNGEFKTPDRHLLLATGAVTAYCLLAEHTDGRWRNGYELSGPGFKYSSPATVHGNGYVDQLTALHAAVNTIDQRLKEVTTAANSSQVAKAAAKRARKILQESRGQIVAHAAEVRGQKAEGRGQTKAATCPDCHQPTSFKPIAAEFRKTLVAKATAIYERHQRGEIRLDLRDANALLRVTKNVATVHGDELRRAIAAVQNDRYAAKPQAKPGTALAVRPASVAVVDGLTGEERKELAKSEAEIDRALKRSLEGFVQSGRELKRIRDGRLYRASHATFEAYLADRWGLKRSSGYDLIDGATAYELAEPVAAKMKVRFTAAAQLRPLVGLTTAADVRAVVQPAVKNTTPGKDGWRVPTMEALKDARRRDEAAPEDLEREREARRQRAEGRGQKADAAELPGQTHFFDAGQGPSAEAPSTAAEAALRMPPGPSLVPPANPEYRVWNGQPRGYAPTLHDVRSDLTALAERWATVDGFTADFAALLHSIAVELKHGLTHSAPKAARRAK